MANVIKMTIQFRRDIADNWAKYGHLAPAAGEPCYILDKNILKIGDGVTPFNDLPEIGGVNFNVDDNTLEMEDGVLKLLGFDGADVGAQPRKNEDGKIEWVKPSTETVDGLKATVAGLQSDVTKMQSTVADLKEIVTPSAEGSMTLLERVESLETKVGEEDVDAKIDAKINEFVSKATGNDIIDTFKELIDYVADHEDVAGTMVKDIADLKILVGEDSVADQIADAVAGKVTAEEGKSLISDTLIAKLEAIEESAQVNKIDEIYLGDKLLDVVDKKVVIPIGAGLKTSNEIEVAEDGSLKIKAISFDKIAQAEDNEIVLNGGGAAG
jgi:hypothetical protein